MRKTAQDTIKVELQKIGESTQFVELPEDSTVEDLIEKADLPEDIELRCKGEVVSLDDILDDGDVLVMPTKKITQG